MLCGKTGAGKSSLGNLITSKTSFKAYFGGDGKYLFCSIIKISIDMINYAINIIITLINHVINIVIRIPLIIICNSSPLCHCTCYVFCVSLFRFYWIHLVRHNYDIVFLLTKVDCHVMSGHQILCSAPCSYHINQSEI